MKRLLVNFGLVAWGVVLSFLVGAGVALVCSTLMGAAQPPAPPTPAQSAADYQAALTLQAQLVADNESPAVLNAAAALVQALKPPARLIQPADITYVRSFQIPVSYYVGGLCYYSAHNSLFAAGTSSGTGGITPLVAELTIPTAANALATVVQQWGDITGGLDFVTNASGVRFGGLCVNGNSLLWSTYPNYNASNNIAVALGQSSLNIAAPAAQGMYALSATVDGKAIPASAMDGWITPIPPAWAPLFQGTHFVGNGGISIIENSSSGPAAFGVDVSKLAVGTPTPAVPYIYYPITQRMPLFNPTANVWCSTCRGLACVANDQVYGMIYAGTQPVGAQWYGLAVTDPSNPNNVRNPPPGLSGTDPCSIYEGNHSQGKCPVFWIYDQNQVATAAKPYSLTPAQVNIGGSTAPCAPLQSVCATFDSMAHDPANGLLYVGQAAGAKTWVHVFQYPH